MLEQGKVIDIQDKFAKILITRRTACGDCGACQVGKDSLNMIVKLENKIDAKKGDNVLIELNTESFLYASLILYGIPLLALVLGIAAPYYALRTLGLANNLVQLIASISGLVLLLLSYLIIKRQESRFNKMNSFKSKMIRIINNK